MARGRDVGQACPSVFGYRKGYKVYKMNEIKPDLLIKIMYLRATRTIIRPSSEHLEKNIVSVTILFKISILLPNLL